MKNVLWKGRLRNCLEIEQTKDQQFGQGYKHTRFVNSRIAAGNLVSCYNPSMSEYSVYNLDHIIDP